MTTIVNDLVYGGMMDMMDKSTGIFLLQTTRSGAWDDLIPFNGSLHLLHCSIV